MAFRACSLAALAAVLLAVPSLAAGELIIDDRNLVRVGFGDGGRMALVRHDAFMGTFEVVDERGQRLAFEWRSPILDAGFLPDGRCAYLVRDDFTTRLCIKAQDGQVLKEFFANEPYQPETLSFSDTGAFFFVARDAQMNWYRIVDGTGFPIHTTFDEPIGALSVTTRDDFHFVAWDRFRERFVLRDRRGVTLHEFDRYEQVLSVRVRAGRVVYACRDTFFNRVAVRDLVLRGVGPGQVRSARREELFDRVHGR